MRAATVAVLFLVLMLPGCAPRLASLDHDEQGFPMAEPAPFDEDGFPVSEPVLIDERN